MVSFRTRSSRGDLQLVGHSVRLLDDRSRIAGAESLADFAKLKSSRLDLFCSSSDAPRISTLCAGPSEALHCLVILETRHEHRLFAHGREELTYRVATAFTAASLTKPPRAFDETSTPHSRFASKMLKRLTVGILCSGAMQRFSKEPV